MPDSNPDPLHTTRRIYLKAVNRADDFTPVGTYETLPARVYIDSRGWSTRVFRTGLGYGDARQAVHAYRIAPNEASYDLLRHAYVAAGTSVTVVESRVFLRISVPAYSAIFAGVDHDRERVGRLAMTLLKLPTPVGFEPVDEHSPDGLFSTNRGVGPWPKLRHWHDRIDAVVDDAVSLLVYKARPNGDFAVNAADWFPGDFPSRSAG